MAVTDRRWVTRPAGVVVAWLAGFVAAIRPLVCTLVACVVVPAARCAAAPQSSPQSTDPPGVVAYYRSVDDWRAYCAQIYYAGNTAGVVFEKYIQLFAEGVAAKINAPGTQRQIADYLVKKCITELRASTG